MMSSFSKRSLRAVITASVAKPACTMIIAIRGFAKEATNPSIESLAMKFASGWLATRSFVFSTERL